MRTEREPRLPYEWLTDLMAHSNGGYLHGGYWAGPDMPSTVAEAGDRLTDIVVERCHLNGGDHVLDVGSGNGAVTVRVAVKHDVRVSGVTISEYQMRLADSLVAERGLTSTVDFVLADMRDTPFPDETFDAAYAIESVCHVPDRTRAYAEIARVLKPGGRVAVTDFILTEPITDRESLDWLAGNLGCFEVSSILPREEYEAAVHAAGLEVVELVDISAAVRPSFAIGVANMRQARHVVGNRISDDEFEECIEALDKFGAITEIGYAIIVLRKPVEQ
jgi:cyclopropane fatty-acyl-phospholipid synthase-like methyltransferase